MKNKKIISLTVVAVGLVLTGILGLSKVFETTWQNENTVDNSLSADTVASKDESIINYPYANYIQMDDESKSLYDDYFYHISDTFIPQKNSDFTYQDAVNITGETIKYLTGYTDHQKTETITELIDYESFLPDRDVDFYTSRFIKVYEDKTITFGSLIDDTTKEIWAINYEELPKGTYTSTHAYKLEYDYTAEQEKEALQTALQYIKEIAPSLQLIEYELQSGDDYNGNLIYNLVFATSEQQSVAIMITDEYKFRAFSRYPYQIPMNYKKVL